MLISILQLFIVENLRFAILCTGADLRSISKFQLERRIFHIDMVGGTEAWGYPL